MRRTTFWSIAIVLMAPGWGFSQVLPNLPDAGDAASPTAIGGKTSIDLIRLEGKSPNVPLRNDGVIKGSERVELDGRLLLRGTDYGIDYPTGTVLLMVPFKEGQSLRATYRFDKALARKSNEFGSSFNSLKLNFTPGATALIGLGMVERKEDGTVLKSDLYAMQTNFAPGGAGLGMKGVIAVGSRSQVRSSNMFERQSNGNAGVTGKGSAILQAMESKLGGGTIKAGYQSIDTNFSGMSALEGQGVDVGQLNKERGLKRLGYTMSGVQMGGMKFSQAMSAVSDGKAGFASRSFGVETGAMKLGFQHRKVDQNFTRFKDLRGEDGGQALQHQAGLETEAWFADYGTKTFNFKLNSKMVEDLASQSFVRRSMEAKFGGIAIKYGDQHVQNGFTKFAGITEADWQQVAREQGIRRQNFSIESGAILGMLQGLSVTSSNFRSDRGRFNALDINAKGKNWTFDQYVRGMDQGMSDTARMSEPEIQSHMATVAKMYEPQGIGMQGNDRNWFLQGAGFERTGSRLQFSPGHGIGVRADHIQFKGSADTGTATSVIINAGKTSLTFGAQEFGQNLTEVSTLMQFERARLGALPGLSKHDMGLSTELGKNRKLQVSMMQAKLGQGDAERQVVQYNDSKIDMKLTHRRVGDQFNNVGQVVDPERELLQQMVGGEQRQMQISAMLRKDLKVKLDWTSGGFDSQSIDNKVNHTLVNWNPDKWSKMEWYKYSAKTNNPDEILYNHEIEKFLVARAIPKLGDLSWEHETNTYAQDSEQLDSVRNTMTVETKIDQKTSLKTEQTKTQFENGDSENIQAHTVSTEVVKGSGVSVSDISIKRTGPAPDERKRNYGFWIDLGRGVKFSYGYARNLNEAGAGVLNGTSSLTGGTFGNLTFGGANYQTQRWDGTRNRALGNFALTTNKPFSVGPLKNFTFNLATDTIRDYGTWHRENNVFNTSAKLLGADIGFDYLSQFSPQARARGVDRTFKFITDQNATKPLRAALSYKVRTLPGGQTMDIRNLTFTGKLNKDFEISHQMQTYPEVPRGDVLLGSVTQPLRTIVWKLEQKTPGAKTKIDALWEERINDQARTMSRTAGLNLTFNATNPSPFNLYYGLEQVDQGGLRRSIHRYSLKYDQRPGANQTFSLFFGNVSWQHGRTADIRRENWSMRMEWQVKF